MPDWEPLDADVVVLLSGAVEIALGLALLALVRQRVIVGMVVGAFFVGAFFVAVFPGNIAQWTGHRNAFGLDTDQARFIRLLFQPLLVAWALWSSEAWKALRRDGASALRRRAADGASPSDEVICAGPYMLFTTVLHAGTRSEGRVGRLHFDRVEVARPAVGGSVEVPTPEGIVRFIYRGEARPHCGRTAGGRSTKVPPPIGHDLCHALVRRHHGRRGGGSRRGPSRFDSLRTEDPPPSFDGNAVAAAHWSRI